MIRILLALFLFANVAWAACTKINMPTDYAVVTNGTRANLKANFSETQNRVNPCMDSVDEVRGRFSGYGTNLAITSLENLRLRIDGDGSTTGIFLVETSNGDSLFRVKEDSTAKFFGDLTVAGGLSSTGATSFPSLTASLPLALNASKQVINGAVTGTGTTQVLSISPSITGTLAAANGTYSGTLGANGLLTATGGILPGLGADGAGRIFQSSVNGLKLRGIAGSSNDFAIMAADNTAIFTNPTGTTGVTLPTTVTMSALAGTGTRLTTSTSTGVQGNATTIAGANTWSDKQTHTSAPRFNSVSASEFLMSDGSKDLTSVAGSGSGAVVRVTGATLVAPALGAATATSIALGGNEAFDYDEGTFTAAATGFSACTQGSLSGSTCTGTARYTRVGKQVVLQLPAMNGTSNSTACTITGIPAAIDPAHMNVVAVDGVLNNSLNYMGAIATNGVQTFGVYFRTSLTGSVTSTFTSGGFKGVTEMTITYTLQ